MYLFLGSKQIARIYEAVTHQIFSYFTRMLTNYNEAYFVICVGIIAVRFKIILELLVI